MTSISTLDSPSQSEIYYEAAYESGAIFLSKDYPCSYHNFIAEAGVIQDEKMRHLSHFVVYHASSQGQLYRDLIAKLQERKTGRATPQNFTYLRIPTGSYITTIRQIIAEMHFKKPSYARFSEHMNRLRHFLSQATEEDIRALYEGIWNIETSNPSSLPNPDLLASYTAQKYFNLASESSGCWETSDAAPSYKDELISVSPSVYCQKQGESARYFWEKSRNDRNIDIHVLLIDILQYYEIPLKHLRELLQIHELIAPYDNALLAIYLPTNDPDLIKRSLYLSHAYGKPCHHRSKDLLSSCHGLQALYVLDKRPKLLPHLDDLQMRLIVNDKDLLNPESGIEIKVYNQIPTEILQEYQARLVKWIENLGPAHSEQTATSAA